ncbi:hypothetical protein [Streptomyces rubiginosohelvolus]|uniref:Uncharacterized protein n=1 Tax=Streptomyces rubiginosohelvolus TaxID=67362 RepID=A0ABQ3CC67_9ACTN|nr:hypothetical protein [Streptomyces pluricolorescens]GGZ82758.1 hypothetical protein GCM10010328_66470 [Streptomyces pluricolorescens]
MNQRSRITGQTTATTPPTLGGMPVVHHDPALNLNTDTTIDRVRVGQTVTATVTLTTIRPTTGSRASGIVTALTGPQSAIVTFNADTNRRLARILVEGNRLILRGQVTVVNGQRVLDVRNGVAVNV